jgi:hypothetical protein
VQERTQLYPPTKPAQPACLTTPPPPHHHPQAALHAGKLYVATKAHSSACSAATSAACSPAVHISTWTLLQRAGAAGSLNPSAFGPGTLIEDEETALAYPAVAVGPSGRPLVGFSMSAAAANGVVGPGYPGVGFTRLAVDGSLPEGATGSPVRAARYGQGPTDPLAAAAGGRRRWGDRSAADAAGGRIYVAVPYAAGGQEPGGGNSGGGAWIAVLEDADA